MAVYSFKYNGIDVSTDKLIEKPEEHTFAIVLPKSSEEAKKIIDTQIKILNLFVRSQFDNGFNEYKTTLNIRQDSEDYAIAFGSYIFQRMDDSDNWLFLFKCDKYISKSCCSI